MRGKTEETKEELVKNIADVEQYLAENKSKYFAGICKNICFAVNRTTLH